MYSAHRTPDKVREFCSKARENDFGVIIAAAGKAAHLAGACAAQTTLPIIGIPVKSSTLDGIDALLLHGTDAKRASRCNCSYRRSTNAALLALQILSVEDKGIAEKLNNARNAGADKVLAADRKLQADIETYLLVFYFYRFIAYYFIWRKQHMEKLEQLYEGKAKKVFATSDPELCIVSYKDDATAFNGLKRAQLSVRAL